MGRNNRLSRWLLAAVCLAGVIGSGSYLAYRHNQGSHTDGDQASSRPTGPQPKAAAPTGASPQATASPQTPSQQRQDQIITVERFGRYALKLSSAQGAALQLVDRMGGPGPSDGVIGQRDGRLDVFLGPGEHQVIKTFAANAQPPELTVQPFDELNSDKLPQLVELALVQGELGDAQQRSYWMVVPSRQTVFIEAAGRHLADLRLWKDGTWLVPDAPITDQSEPKTGQPLAVKRLVATLEPGLYRLIAYGGAGLPWTMAGTEKPFALRWGIPELPQTGRRPMSAGPFGFDRWLVSGDTTLFRLELPRGDKGVIEVATYDQGRIGGASRAVIDKTTRSQAADVIRQPSAEKHLVTIRTLAAQDYVLQNFPNKRDYSFDAPANSPFLVSAWRPGLGADDPDLTAILTESNARSAPKVIASQTLRLGPNMPWMRHFNLLADTTLLVEITRAGRYRADISGVQADLQIVPFSVPGGAAAKATPPQLNNAAWNLDAGFYSLRLSPRPEQRGIAGLSLYGDGTAKAAEDSPPLPAAALFTPTSGRTKTDYLLTTSQSAGFAVQRLPVKMTGDMPLALRAGSENGLSLPIALPTDGKLQVLGDDGRALDFSLDDGAAVPQPAVKAGSHQIRVTAPDAGPLTAVLRFTPDAKPAPPPALPVLSDADAQKIPALPVLSADQPHFLDLERKQSQTFLVKVDRPALYRVETTGLLETAGTIRTQVHPSLSSAAANGVGRNMLLQQYLRQGVYLLTVSAQGLTEGHLGLTLTAAPLRQGGPLGLGIAAHAALGSGDGIAYDLDIATAGTYRLRALTPDIAAAQRPTRRTEETSEEAATEDNPDASTSDSAGEPATDTADGPLIRLEDDAGWPLTTPDQTGDLETTLQPGHYRLIVQPLAMPSRLLTLVESVRPSAQYAGHGPHALPLGETVANRWDEPAQGDARTPDVWTFTLPADADLIITLSEGMQAELKADGNDTPATAFSFRQPWQGRLSAGTYSLQASTVRPNNRFDYTVSTQIEQLVAGQSRTVTAPALIPLALGDGHRFELTSFGTGQIKATVLDKDGRPVARGDNRADDWNINLAARLPAGQYQLKLEPVGQPQASTTLTLRELAEIQDQPLGNGEDRHWGDGALHSLPLRLGTDDGPLIVAVARSQDAVGLALERREGDGTWISVASASGSDAVLAFPRDPAAEYRLQSWPLAGSRAAITLALRAPNPSSLGEGGLMSGITLSPLAGIDPPVGIAAVKLDGPGLIRLTTPAARLIWGDGAQPRALAHGPDVAALNGGPLWLVGPVTGESVKGQRISAATNDVLSLTLQEKQTVTLPLTDDGKGPRLWLAESRVGQPGLSIAPAADPGNLLQAGIDTGATAALLPDSGDGSGKVLRLWRADSTDEMPVTLRRIVFARATRDDLEWGEADRDINAGAALELTLPDGPKHLRLALPPRMAAALLDQDGQVRRLFWPDQRPASIVLDSDARRLLLLNTALQPGRLSLTIMPPTGGLALSPGVMLRQTQAAAGLLSIDVSTPDKAEAKPQTLVFSGPVQDAWLIRRDGVIQHGLTDLTPSSQGTLLIKHQPGLVAAWMTDGGAPGWLENAAKASAQKIAPAALPLSGTETVWRFAPQQPVLLHLRSQQPVLTALSGGRQSVWPQGADLQMFLPAGKDSLLGLRPLQDTALSGTAAVSFSQPQPLAEGLGPKLRLAPGDARLFTFTLAEAGSVGVGIKGEADSAHMRLYGQNGDLLAEGALAMNALQAGRYFLVVENRADADAVEVQPALVGAVKPGKAPPEDIKRKYWDMVSEEEGK